MKDKSIKELIQELAGDQAAELYAKPCEVMEVDEYARTCDVRPYDDTGMIYGVRLQAVEGSEKGAVIIPTVGAGVIVVFLSKSRAVVVLSEQLDKIIIDCDEVTYNGGSFGGWYKAPATNTELNKLKDRITQLETALDAFATTQIAAAAAYPPLPVGYTTLKTSIGLLPAQGTFDGDLIDDKIKH